MINLPAASQQSSGFEYSSEVLWGLRWFLQSPLSLWKDQIVQPGKSSLKAAWSWLQFDDLKEV